MSKQGDRIVSRRARKYTREQFYVETAMKRGWSATKVVHISERRARAFMAVCGIQNNYRALSICHLDNPFMESHLWKFMVRQVIRNARMVAASKKKNRLLRSAQTS